MTGPPSTKEALEGRIRRERKAVLLINTRARRAGSHREAEERLLAAGFQITSRHLVDDPKSLEEHIVQALFPRPPLLIVGSGDGTIAQVVDHLAYTDTVLGYLPLGTTNNFGRSLMIPRNFRRAVDVIANGKVADVDLGQVNGDYFANMVGMGISATVAGHTPRLLKRAIGRLAYGLSSFGTLLVHKPFTLELTVHASTQTLRTHQFSIANGRMHSGWPIASDASVDNRTLVAYSLGSATRASALRAILLQAMTSKQSMKRKNYFTGRSLKVVTSPPQDIEIDGEIKKAADAGEYVFEVAGEALKVLVPQQFKDE